METGTHHPEPRGARQGQSTEEAKQKAKELTRTARERALSTLDAQRTQLGSVLERVADSIQDDRIGAYAADYARRGAAVLRERSAEEIFGSIRAGLRSRPGLVLSACFVAGLAFARIAKGSIAGGRDGGELGERRFDAGRWSEPGYGESGYAEGTWGTPGPTAEDAARGGTP
jgi:hypothetical protein